MQSPVPNTIYLLTNLIQPFFPLTPSPSLVRANFPFSPHAVYPYLLNPSNPLLLSSRDDSLKPTGSTGSYVNISDNVYLRPISQEKQTITKTNVESRSPLPNEQLLSGRMAAQFTSHSDLILTSFSSHDACGYLKCVPQQRVANHSNRLETTKVCRRASESPALKQNQQLLERTEHKSKDNVQEAAPLRRDSASPSHLFPYIPIDETKGGLPETVAGSSTLFNESLSPFLPFHDFLSSWFPHGSDSSLPILRQTTHLEQPTGHTKSSIKKSQQKKLLRLYGQAGCEVSSFPSVLNMTVVNQVKNVSAKVTDHNVRCKPPKKSALRADLRIESRHFKMQQPTRNCTSPCGVNKAKDEIVKERRDTEVPSTDTLLRKEGGNEQRCHLFTLKRKRSHRLSRKPEYNTTCFNDNDELTSGSENAVKTFYAKKMTPPLGNKDSCENALLKTTRTITTATKATKRIRETLETQKRVEKSLVTCYVWRSDVLLTDESLLSHDHHESQKSISKGGDIHSFPEKPVKDNKLCSSYHCSEKKPTQAVPNATLTSQSNGINTDIEMNFQQASIGGIATKTTTSSHEILPPEANLITRDDTQLNRATPISEKQKHYVLMRSMSDEHFNFFQLSKARKKEGFHPSLHVLHLPAFLQSHTTFKPSSLLNEFHYKNYRNETINADEAHSWSSKLIKVIHKNVTSPEQTSTIKTAVRRGVPDFLKHDVLMLAQNASRFKEQHPKYYDNQLHHAFGDNIPQHFHDRVPTFCGGFLGLEEEILHTPLDIDKLEANCNFNVCRRQISWLDLKPVDISLGRNKNDFPFTFIGDKKSTTKEKLPTEEFNCDAEGDKRNCNITYNNPEDISSVLNPSDFITEANNKARRKLRKKKGIDMLRLHFFKRSLRSLVLFPCKGSRRIQPHAASTIYNSPMNTSFFSSNLCLRKPKSSDQTGIQDVYRVESVTYLHELLSEQGLNAVKRLLWCLNSTFPELEFCPILPCLLCVALFYLSELETFFLISSLLNEARVRARTIQEIPFLMCRRSEYIRFVKFGMEVAKRCMSKLIQYLISLQMDVAAWIARCMAQGLLRFVTFDVLLRIYGTFFFEGYSVILRYCLAIFKINTDKLLQCHTKEQAEQVLFSTRNIASVKDTNHLTQTAFCMSIKWSKGGVNRYTSYDVPTPFLVEVKLQRFYRPRLGELSQIINFVQWEYLWGWIPQRFRTLDPYIAWRASRNGLSFIAIEKQLESKSQEPVLLLIRTKCRAIIGGFFSEAVVFLPRNRKRVDDSHCCVFQLSPKVNVYYWSAAHVCAVRVSFEALIIGLDDSAIYVDGSIHHGRSRPCLSFQSPQLAGNENGDFIVDLMEIWTLH